jgi:hypothetical protein
LSACPRHFETSTSVGRLSEANGGAQATGQPPLGHVAAVVNVGRLVEPPLMARSTFESAAVPLPT